MFCEKCGKELKDDWKKCPYCGQIIGGGSIRMEGQTEMPSQVVSPPLERNFSDNKPKKKGTLKKILLGIGGVFLILVVIAIITPSGDDSSSSGNKESQGKVDVELEHLSEKDKTDVDDIAMYLTNSSEALPVKIENVYQESVYMGFTTFNFDMVNVTDVDIKKAKFGVVAWDSNMLPLELTEMYDIESVYFYTCQGGNIAAGQTSQASVSFEERDFKYMQILLLEYIDFEENTWTNPAAVYYEENFAGKKFDENAMTAMVFDANNIDNTDDNVDISDDVEDQKDIISCTGDFFTDVDNGALYGKDGIVVDVNGNALSEYSDYFITEEGYISNGDWVEEGYTIDDTGKIIQFQM